VFGPDLIGVGLSRVPADGGRVEPATLLDVDRGENSHRWPAFLPDGIHFLYFVRASVDERRGIYLGALDRPAAPPGEPLFRSESEAVYAPLTSADDGVLLYEANGVIEARRFNASALALVGDAGTLSVPVGGNTLYHPALLSASAGLLATAASPIPYGVRLNSIARNGAGHRVWEEREGQNWPRVSPDGRWLARQRIDARRGDPDIWVEDLQRGTRLRVTTGPDNDLLPVWSPDSRRLAYLALGRTTPTLRIAAADGTGSCRPFLVPS
jgi:eukaryotic-like serine/threonine-protein kinase